MRRERERERERESELDRAPTPDASTRLRRWVRIAEIVPPRSHHHWDRTPALAPPSRSSPPKIDPSKTNLVLNPKLIGAVVLVFDPKLIGVADLVAHDRSHCPWPMTDLSLSLNFWSLSLPSSLSLTELWSLTNGVVFIFVFLSLYIEIFYYKICLVVEKMGEKMWERSRKMAFSECNQTHENIF